MSEKQEMCNELILNISIQSNPAFALIYTCLGCSIVPMEMGPEEMELAGKVLGDLVQEDLELA